MSVTTMVPRGPGATPCTYALVGMWPVGSGVSRGTNDATSFGPPPLRSSTRSPSEWAAT